MLLGKAFSRKSFSSAPLWVTIKFCQSSANIYHMRSIDSLSVNGSLFLQNKSHPCGFPNAGTNQNDSEKPNITAEAVLFFSSFPEGEQRQQSVPVEAETHGPGWRNYREGSKKQTISSYQYGVWTPYVLRASCPICIPWTITVTPSVLNLLLLISSDFASVIFNATYHVLMH